MHAVEESAKHKKEAEQAVAKLELEQALARVRLPEHSKYGRLHSVTLFQYLQVIRFPTEHAVQTCLR